MITLKDWMELVDYKITEGSDWYCNVSNTYSLSFWDGNQDGVSSTIVFSTKLDKKVYMVYICDYKNNTAYISHTPEIEVDEFAWDDVPFVKLDSMEFLQVSKNIMRKSLTQQQLQDVQRSMNND